MEPTVAETSDSAPSLSETLSGSTELIESNSGEASSTSVETSYQDRKEK